MSRLLGVSTSRFYSRQRCNQGPLPDARQECASGFYLLWDIDRVDALRALPSGYRHPRHTDSQIARQPLLYTRKRIANLIGLTDGHLYEALDRDDVIVPNPVAMLLRADHGGTPLYSKASIPRWFIWNERRVEKRWSQ